MAVESSVGKQIREVLATSLRRDPSSIKPEHSLREDLGLDSLMTFELLYDLEKAFDLEIPNDDLPGLQTLDDVVKYVEGRVNPSAKPPTLKSKAKTSVAAKPAKTATPTKAVKTPTPKGKTAKPAKANTSTASGKTRAASAPKKPRPSSTSTKGATPTKKKRTPVATPKVKKK